MSAGLDKHASLGQSQQPPRFSLVSQVVSKRYAMWAPWGKCWQTKEVNGRSYAYAVGIHGSALVTLSWWDSDMLHLFYTISVIPHYQPRTHLELNKSMVTNTLTPSKPGQTVIYYAFNKFQKWRYYKTEELEEMYRSKLLKCYYSLYT